MRNEESEPRPTSDRRGKVSVFAVAVVVCALASPPLMWLGFSYASRKSEAKALAKAQAEVARRAAIEEAAERTAAVRRQAAEAGSARRATDEANRQRRRDLATEIAMLEAKVSEHCNYKVSVEANALKNKIADDADAIAVKLRAAGLDVDSKGVVRGQSAQRRSASEIAEMERDASSRTIARAQEQYQSSLELIDECERSRKNLLRVKAELR